MALFSACAANPTPSTTVTESASSSTSDSASSSANSSASSAASSAPTASATSASSAQGALSTFATQDNSLKAVATALKHVSGGVAIELDRDDDDSKYEIDVILGNVKHELDISADGTKVLKQEKDDADADDKREASAAKITMQKAISLAQDESSGTVDDVDLSDDDQDLAWQIDFDDDRGHDSDEVHVDAATGKILTKK